MQKVYTSFYGSFHFEGGAQKKDQNEDVDAHDEGIPFQKAATPFTMDAEKEIAHTEAAQAGGEHRLPHTPRRCRQ